MVFFTNLGIDLMHRQIIEWPIWCKDFDRMVEFIHWQHLFITTLQNYTNLAQYNSILNNSIKQITPINILINLSSLPTCNSPIFVRFDF